MPYAVSLSRILVSIPDAWRFQIIPSHSFHAGHLRKVPGKNIRNIKMLDVKISMVKMYEVKLSGAKMSNVNVKCKCKTSYTHAAV